jgi:GNAT superfamily N-acetyltransferase
MTVTISPATEEEVQSGEIGRRLREFNYTYVGEYPATKYIRLNAREAGGSVVGGIRAVVALYWLRVEVLWVDEAARGRGIGSRLLDEAERLAREMGARNAALETFEWQAPSFYQKHGYEEVVRLERYAKGFYLADEEDPMRVTTHCT